MLKITKLSNSALRELEVNNDKVVGDASKADDRNLSKKSKNTMSKIQIHFKTTKEPTFLTPGTKKVFN